MSDDDQDPPKPTREALWQRLAVGCLSGLIWLVGILPTWLAYGLGLLLAVPWFLWWSLHDRRGRRSSGYWRNCRIAFRPGSPLGPQRPKRHLWRWSVHIAWLAIDFCRMGRVRRETVRQHCDLTEYPRIDELARDGKGFLFVTGHIGVWDVAGWAAGLIGLPLWSVFRPSPLPALNRLIERLRTGSGQTVIARKNVMRSLLRLLGDQKVVAILADGGGKHSAVEAPFLGTAARTVASPALLHLATGAPIAVVAMLRTGPMRYRLRVFDVIRDAATGDREADLLAITTRINRALGRGIAEAPEQWFWQSRRFRHRPAGEVPGPDGLPPLVDPVPPPR
ncbi:MAG: lysophospholipid acyltransferase family protein [Planctomycetes bacterium]|jgi:KDO2-lipid IV(A) lauroyltransferase|nr:lysophospholipid acyltransferase family protein [Planctomycetota bacterium]